MTEDNNSFLQASQSVDRLFNNLSINSTVVPVIDQYADVGEFIAAYEAATVFLTEDQKVRLLTRAFPPGNYRIWYKDNIDKPTISSWIVAKRLIISRYGIEDAKDVHFNRIQNMKFDPRNKEKLYDYVEELAHSLSQALGRCDEETKIRYIKSNLPAEVRLILSHYVDYESNDFTTFLKAIRKYDVIKATEHEKLASMSSTEVKTKLDKLIEEVAELKNSNASIMAVYKTRSRSPYRNNNPNEQYRCPSRSPNRPPGMYVRSYNQNDGGRANYQNPSRQSNEPGYGYRGNRSTSRSPMRRNDEFGAQRIHSSNFDTKSMQKDHNPVPFSFDMEEYYRKYRMPPYPCRKCEGKNLFHWENHHELFKNLMDLKE